MRPRPAAVAALTSLTLLAACGSEEGTSSAERPASAERRSDETGTETRVVIDHWERDVEVPVDVNRVVVMEWEGLAAKSLHLFGLAETIVGVDSATARQPYRRSIVPALDDAVDVGSAWSGINYEQLAALDPDVVFLESWQASAENLEMHQVEVDKIEALGIPVIVFVSPSNFPEPDLATAWQHIEIVGQVFEREDEAAELVASVEERLDLIRERTADIPEDEKADVVIFATIDNVMGARSIQSHLLTDVVNANNLVTERTSFVTVSDEQLLALDPDVLVVIGHDGYLDPERIYAGENVGLNWANLQGLDAIAERRLVSIGYDEWRATLETPIGLLKVAAAVYPDRFDDIDVEAEELRFYEEVYGLDAEAAAEAVEAQRYTGELDG